MSLCFCFALADGSIVSWDEYFPIRLQLEVTSETSASILINIDDTVEVSGFQIDLSGGTISGFNSADSLSQSFTISNDINTILGYNHDQTAISDTEGSFESLIEVTLDSPDASICFGAIVKFSDSMGELIEHGIDSECASF